MKETKNALYWNGETIVEPADAQITMHGDEVQIRRVLQNLAENAIHSMGHTGILRVVITNAAPNVEIEVIDNGCGISNDVLPKIFEPYFSTRKSTNGIGLGLSIVRRIVENHGGTITVSSRIGGGTTFRVILQKGAG